LLGPSPKPREPYLSLTMKIPGMAAILSFVLVLHSLSFVCCTVHHKVHQPDQSAEDEATQLANEVTAEMDLPQGTKTPLSMTAQKGELKKDEPLPEDAVKADAHNAKEAAAVAKQAAHVANKVAEHSVHIVAHTKEALHHALGALHDARVDTEGLSTGQKDSLKKAEGQLREATKKAEYGKLKKLKEKSALDLKKERMEEELKKRKARKAELEQLKSEIKHLRNELKKKGGDAEEDKQLHEMEDMLNKRKDTDTEPTNDELKAEVERLREQIERMEKQDTGAVVYHIPKEAEKDAPAAPNSDEQDEEEKEELMRDVQIKPLESRRARARA